MKRDVSTADLFFVSVVIVVLILSAILYSIILLSIFVVLEVIWAGYSMLHSKKKLIQGNIILIVIFLLIGSMSIFTLRFLCDLWPPYVMEESDHPYYEDWCCDICGGKEISWEHGLPNPRIYIISLNGERQEYCHTHFILYIITHMYINDVNIHYHDIPKGELYIFTLLQFQLYFLIFLSPFSFLYISDRNDKLKVILVYVIILSVLWMMLFMPSGYHIVK